MIADPVRLDLIVEGQTVEALEAVSTSLTKGNLTAAVRLVITKGLEALEAERKE